MTPPAIQRKMNRSIGSGPAFFARTSFKRASPPNRARRRAAAGASWRYRGKGLCARLDQAWPILSNVGRNGRYIPANQGNPTARPPARKAQKDRRFECFLA
jgi:hypothetical protein